MSKISDNLREFADAEVLSAIQISDLKHMAKRIDAEMVELPKDRDGVPIHVGDTVYLDDGRKAEVRRIQLSEREDSICFDVCGDFFSFWPEHLTHTAPDSFERIADELDKMVDAASNADDTCERLADLAGRIRKLVKEQGNE